MQERSNLWLLRLSSLPRPLYAEVVNRLARGDGVWSVARWLMAQPKRGGLQNVHEWALRKYLYALAEVVKRKKRENPPATMAELRAEVQVVQYQPESLAAPGLGPRGQHYQSIESFVGDLLQNYNRVLWLLALLQHFWEELERLRMVEEEYHHEKKLPTHPLCRARAQIGQILLGIMKELRENDALDLAKARQASGGLSPELASQLDQRLSDTEKQIAGMVKEFSPEQRAIMRSMWRNMKAKTQFDDEPEPPSDPQRRLSGRPGCIG